MRNPTSLDGSAQRGGDVILSDDFRELARTVETCERRSMHVRG